MAASNIQASPTDLSEDARAIDDALKRELESELVSVGVLIKSGLDRLGATANPWPLSKGLRIMSLDR